MLGQFQQMPCTFQSVTRVRHSPRPASLSTRPAVQSRCPATTRTSGRRPHGCTPAPKRASVAAAAAAGQPDLEPVAIIGSGIMGLATATQLRAAYPDVPIHLIYDKTVTETTSYGSGGAHRVALRHSARRNTGCTALRGHRFGTCTRLSSRHLEHTSRLCTCSCLKQRAHK